jgi:NADP-dependent 3-hydroxy acid dehydrogenase YdfG
MKSKKIIALTGASSGIGKATALALSNSPHMLVLLSRNEKKLNEIAKSLDCPVLVIPADVTNIEEMEKAFVSIEEKFGGLDILINNAGVGMFDPIDNAKLNEWHTMIDVNIKGVVNCLHFALPLLKKSLDGQIINVASVAAHQVFPNSGVYCATKHAVGAISKSLHLEMGTQLKITTISPGAVDTAFVDNTTNENMIGDLKKYFAEGLTPEVIAEQIVHCIEQPPNVTISEIIVRPKR